MNRRWIGVVIAGVACAGGCSNKKPSAKKDGGPIIDASPGSDGAAPIDASPIAACTATHGTTISVREIGKVSGSAVLATAAPGDGRLFVIEQAGRIRVFDNQDNLLATPFLDISTNNGGPVVAGGEQGLLGLAFDPNYQTNHQFYVDYTAANPVSGGDPYVDVVVRYTTSALDPNVADPTSATPILSIVDYAVNHNAGMIEFGSDGDLYVSTGDGGGAGDPRRNAQNPNALLGKMLRLDVDHPAGGKPYGIPADNPFADGQSGAPEVYMLGLRNPWRWSFDRANGDMWIGDVGQGQIEELDYLPAGQQLGTNLGWSAYEANVCCSMQTDSCVQSAPFQACDTTGKFFPQVTRSHGGDGWNAIIGGQVYRGPCYPDLTGIYFFTDNGHHGLSEATVTGGTVTAVDLPGTWPASPASIHADARGELYMTTTGGDVLHIEAGP